MSEEISTPNTETSEMSDEQAILKIAQAMKDNAPSQEDKFNVPMLFFNVITSKDTTKCGNLTEIELGKPQQTVRGDKDLMLISDKIMENDFFKEYFEVEAENTLATSLSKDAVLLRLAVTQTKQIADITKKRTRNRGMFRSTTTDQGGDTIINNSPPNV